MSSQPATMAEATRPQSHLIHRGLPDEIVVWEILLRLPPKSILRCRAVCRAWRLATSTCDFLLAHHHRQPSLPVVMGSECLSCRYEVIHAFDHRADDAQLQPVARFEGSFNMETSCDGLIILSKHGMAGTCLYVCNPATREHAPLGPPWDFRFFNVLGMYLHRPTDEYRLLLHRRSHSGSTIGHMVPKGKIGCYVFVLGSDQQPRYIGGLDAAAALYLGNPALLCDSLHWYPMHHQGESGLLLVFDTTTESFRQMRAPVVPIKSNIFEMNDTLGIYIYNSDIKIVDIWVLQNYESEVWDCKYRVKLPVTKIKGQFGLHGDHGQVSVAWGHGDVLLMVTYGPWLFSVDTNGELVASFHHDGENLYNYEFRLKETLVQHTFFTALEGSVVNASPFV